MEGMQDSAVQGRLEELEGVMQPASAVSSAFGTTADMTAGRFAGDGKTEAFRPAVEVPMGPVGGEEEELTPAEEQARRFGGRDEEAVLFQEPIQIRLGGRIYEVRPLPWRKNRAWRKRHFELLGRSAKLAEGLKSDDPEQKMAAIMAAQVEMPDEMEKLLEEYCAGQVALNVFEQATESEIIEAGKAVAKLAHLPFQGGE